MKLAEPAQRTDPRRGKCKESRRSGPRGSWHSPWRAGWLASLSGGCSAVGASVRDESHQWDAKSRSPPGFYGAPSPRQEGPRASHARVTPTATSRPQQRGRRLEPQTAEVAGVCSHPHSSSAGKREQPRARTPRSPLSFPSSPARAGRRGDRSRSPVAGIASPLCAGLWGPGFCTWGSISGVGATTVRVGREAAEQGLRFFPLPEQVAAEPRVPAAGSPKASVNLGGPSPSTLPKLRARRGRDQKSPRGHHWKPAVQGAVAVPQLPQKVAAVRGEAPIQPPRPCLRVS